MITRIWKQRICLVTTPNTSTLEIHRFKIRQPARILDIQVQNAYYVFWYEADMNGGEFERIIAIKGFFTDDEVQDFSAMNYISTTQLDGIVIHWYWILELNKLTLKKSEAK